MVVIEVEQELQELKNISKCLNSNKLVLNLDKTIQMGVTLAAKASDSFCFNLGGKYKRKQFVRITEYLLISESFLLEAILKKLKGS